CPFLRGAIVIYDPNDPLKHLYDVDNENTVITLTDGYHTPAIELTEQYINVTRSVPIPDTGLINGAGRYLGGPTVPFHIVNVRSGRKYRLRVVNIGCRPFHSFSVDSQTLTTMRFDIYAGQKYSAVVSNYFIYRAHLINLIPFQLQANQPVGNY
ncbi:multicopper oxidase, partial [Sphaerobolus stellatus SS14]